LTAKRKFPNAAAAEIPCKPYKSRMPTPPARTSKAEQTPPASREGTRRIAGWIVLWAVIFALIIIPFVLLETQLKAILDGAFAAVRGQPLLGGALIIALLAGDCVLPVPSSLVSAFAGAAFNWAAGSAVIWTGMTLGCVFGYGLGASAGRVLAVRLVGDAELERSRALFAEAGPAALIITRAVPVLAEAGVLAAGAARMPFGRFIAATSLANAGVATIFAATGAVAASTGSFLLVFTALAALPALGWAGWCLAKARRSAN
jgi:membrane protein DedA with SNARE-associated domain